MPTHQPLIPENIAMPTGVPLQDAREQLFAAAVRVLLRDGPDALTSRAVTTETGVAKGILHRHFADFDAFLAALVLSRIDLLDDLSAQLRASAGSATVDENLAGALAAVLTPDVLAIVSLVMSRRELLARLRPTTPTGMPLLTETTKMIAAYLTAERGLGRIPFETDVDSLALILVGSAHLLASQRDAGPLSPGDLRDLLRATTHSTAPLQPRRIARA
jgi:AcrR family transcriptional regulator